MVRGFKKWLKYFLFYRLLCFFDDAVLEKYTVVLEELSPEFQNMVNGI
jgi:hypothetical protein